MYADLYSYLCMGESVTHVLLIEVSSLYFYSFNVAMKLERITI